METFFTFLLQNDFVFSDSANMGISLSYLLIIDLYSYNCCVDTTFFLLAGVTFAKTNSFSLTFTVQRYQISIASWYFFHVNQWETKLIA